MWRQSRVVLLNDNNKTDSSIQFWQLMRNNKPVIKYINEEKNISKHSVTSTKKNITRARVQTTTQQLTINTLLSKCRFSKLLKELVKDWFLLVLKTNWKLITGPNKDVNAPLFAFEFDQDQNQYYCNTGNNGKWC